LETVKRAKAELMSNEEYLNESLRKIAKGAGFVLIGKAFGNCSRIITG